MNESDTIARLETEERALVSALAEFEHEERRVRDQLERQAAALSTSRPDLNSCRKT